MNSQHASTNIKGYLVDLKRGFKAGLKISNIQIQIRLRFGITNSINTHLRLRIPLEFETFDKYLEYTKPNLSLEYKIEIKIKNIKHYLSLTLKTGGLNRY